MASRKISIFFASLKKYSFENQRNSKKFVENFLKKNLDLARPVLGRALHLPPAPALASPRLDLEGERENEIEEEGRGDHVSGICAAGEKIC